MKVSKCCGQKIYEDASNPDCVLTKCSCCGLDCETEETEPEQDEDVGDNKRER